MQDHDQAGISKSRYRIGPKILHNPLRVFNERHFFKVPGEKVEPRVRNQECQYRTEQ